MNVPRRHLDLLTVARRSGRASILFARPVPADVLAERAKHPGSGPGGGLSY